MRSVRAASFDKFSTQKRRREKTARSRGAGDNKSPARIPNPASAGRAWRSGRDIRLSKPLFGFDSRGLMEERPPSSAGIAFRSAVLLISPGKSFRNSKGQVACGK